MRTFELRVSAVADIVEIWHVKAATADAARDVFNGEGTDNVEFVATVDMNDERDRIILSCEPAPEALAAPERGNVTPPAIAAALEEVATHHPQVARVLFLNDSNNCGVWQYQDADGEAVPFSEAVNVGALEDALDAAEAFGLPCVFERAR